jgi:oligosaccharide repeat unit polymerase
LLLIMLIPSITSGNRSVFIYFVSIVLVIYLSTGFKIKFKHLILALSSIPVLLFAPSSYRGQSTLSLTSLRESFSIQSFQNFLTAGDTLMAPAMSILLQNLQNGTVEFNGFSYINILLKPIPRDIWSSKPIEFDTQLMYANFPEYARFVGFSFSSLSEPYANFGLLGVIGFFLLLGFLNQRLFLRSLKQQLLPILTNSWTATFMYILARGNLSTDIHRILFPLITIFIIYKMSRQVNERIK